MNPWPTTKPDPMVSEALDIAMDYLHRTGQTEDYWRVEAVAVAAITAAYRSGIHHRIVLADKAIVAVERQTWDDEELASLYPRVC